MQAPTHILAGVLIQKAFVWKQHRRLALGLTAVCAFLSHGLLDKLARLTYHRANPDFHSPIWVGYHAALILVTLLFLYWWWKPFKWGIIFASLPDLDRVFIHAQEIFHFSIPFYRQPHLHNAPLPWSTLQGGTVTASPFTVTDPDAINHSQRFYYLTNSP